VDPWAFSHETTKTVGVRLRVSYRFPVKLRARRLTPTALFAVSRTTEFWSGAADLRRYADDFARNSNIFRKFISGGGDPLFHARSKSPQVLLKINPRRGEGR
jgi:hypothetical protein